MSHACVNPAEHQPADLTPEVVKGRMARHQPRVDELWRRYPVKRGALLQALWLVQEEFGWVPRTGIKWAAEVSGVSPAHAFGVTEFYTMYRQVPTGKHLVQICQTMCCFQQGSEDLIAHLEKALGVHAGGTSEDGLFTLVRVECLALCGSGPGVMIDDQAIGPVPHALGQGDLREAHLDVPDFHPTAAILDSWLAFLRAEHARNPAASKQPVTGDAIGKPVLDTKGHPGAPGAAGKTLPPGYCPAPPALKLAAKAVGQTINLSWINDGACSKVVVERSDDQGASWRELVTPGPKDQKAVDSLAVGASASYRVIAHEKDRAARPSAVVTATGENPPPAPAAVPAPAKA